MGLVVGGVVTAPLAATLGSANLLLVWAALIAGTTGLAWRLVRTEGISLAAPRARARRRGSDLTGGLTDVMRSGLLRWMSAANLLISLLFSLLYLAFSRVAVERYPDPDKLAGFFGVFFAIAMAAAFVISLLVTSRLLARFGVPTVVLVLPLLYLVGFGVSAVAATFAILLAFRFAQVAWDNGGANGTWEALINTFPADRRDRARAFLYGVPLQLGTILAGLVAFIAQRLAHPTIVYGAGLVGAVLAVAIGLAHPRRVSESVGRRPARGAPGNLRRAPGPSTRRAQRGRDEPGCPRRPTDRRRSSRTTARGSRFRRLRAQTRGGCSVFGARRSRRGHPSGGARIARPPGRLLRHPGRTAVPFRP